MYTATLRDNAVLSEFDLHRLLGLLAEIQSPGEDAVVWQGPRVVAVRHGDGRLTVPASAAAPDEGAAEREAPDDEAPVDLAALSRGAA